jgi:hypothetical protein
VAVVSAPRGTGGVATGTIPIVALDLPSAEAALGMVDRLGDACRFYKVGNELFTAAGPDLVRRLTERGVDVFLDLKFHDIPNTVGAGVRSAARLGARLVTVHASGGRAMLDAAVRGAEEGGGGCGVLAVTVLTSLDAAAVAAAWGREAVDVAAEVLRLPTRRSPPRGGARRWTSPRRSSGWPATLPTRGRTGSSAAGVRSGRSGRGSATGSPRSCRGCGARGTPWGTRRAW